MDDSCPSTPPPLSGFRTPTPRVPPGMFPPAMEMNMSCFTIDTEPNHETAVRTRLLAETAEDARAEELMHRLQPSDEAVSSIVRPQLVSVPGTSLTGPEVSLEARLNPTHPHHHRLQEQIQRHTEHMAQIALTAPTGNEQTSFMAAHVEAGRIMAADHQSHADHELAQAIASEEASRIPSAAHTIIQANRAMQQTQADHQAFLAREAAASGATPMHASQTRLQYKERPCGRPKKGKVWSYTDLGWVTPEEFQAIQGQEVHREAPANSNNGGEANVEAPANSNNGGEANVEEPAAMQKCHNGPRASRQPVPQASFCPLSCTKVLLLSVLSSMMACQEQGGRSRSPRWGVSILRNGGWQGG